MSEPQFTEIMPNTLQVHHAGYGVTPPCPQAKFKPGNMVRIRRHKARGVPAEGCIALVVPPGFPAEYALADFHKRPRPLMISRESRSVQYVVGFLDNPTPYLFKESALMPSKSQDAEVKWGEPATPNSEPAQEGNER